MMPGEAARAVCRVFLDLEMDKVRTDSSFAFARASHSP
jgi:hypothetical protein